MLVPSSLSYRERGAVGVETSEYPSEVTEVVVCGGSTILRLWKRDIRIKLHPQTLPSPVFSLSVLWCKMRYNLSLKHLTVSLPAHVKLLPK